MRCNCAGRNQHHNSTQGECVNGQYEREDGSQEDWDSITRARFCGEECCVSSESVSQQVQVRKDDWAEVLRQLYRPLKEEYCVWRSVMGVVMTVLFMGALVCDHYYRLSKQEEL
jgi:hypothetical protein